MIVNDSQWPLKKIHEKANIKILMFGLFILIRFFYIVLNKEMTQMKMFLYTTHR